MKEKTPKNNEGDKVMREAFKTMNEAQADRGLSEWVGAIFYYFINSRKQSFDELYSKKYESRNIWTGYFLKLFIVAIGLYLFFKLADYLEL